MLAGRRFSFLVFSSFSFAVLDLIAPRCFALLFVPARWLSARRVGLFAADRLAGRSRVAPALTISGEGGGTSGACSLGPSSRPFTRKTITASPSSFPPPSSLPPRACVWSMCLVFFFFLASLLSFPFWCGPASVLALGSRFRPWCIHHFSLFRSPSRPFWLLRSSSIVSACSFSLFHLSRSASSRFPSHVCIFSLPSAVLPLSLLLLPPQSLLPLSLSHSLSLRFFLATIAYDNHFNNKDCFPTSMISLSTRPIKACKNKKTLFLSLCLPPSLPPSLPPTLRASNNQIINHSHIHQSN